MERCCALAATAGLPVSPHVLPDLHIHLAAAFGDVIGLEMTDPAQGIEGMHQLLVRTLPIAGGMATAPEEPGLGCEIDWAAAERMARRWS